MYCLQLFSISMKRRKKSVNSVYLHKHISIVARKRNEKKTARNFKYRWFFLHCSNRGLAVKWLLQQLFIRIGRLNHSSIFQISNLKKKQQQQHVLHCCGHLRAILVEIYKKSHRIAIILLRPTSQTHLLSHKCQTVEKQSFVLCSTNFLTWCWQCFQFQHKVVRTLCTNTHNCFVRSNAYKCTHTDE